VGSYAKAHLVPFGEYLPLRPLLTPLGLSRLVAGETDDWPGPGPRTLDFGAYGLGKVGMQICYEIVFPARWSTARIAPISCSPLPTTAGSAPGARPSIWRRPGCARSRKACRCCAPPPTASRR
jgi:apolipoprotein N-acyltransferase